MRPHSLLPPAAAAVMASLALAAGASLQTDGLQLASAAVTVDVAASELDRLLGLDMLVDLTLVDSRSAGDAASSRRLAVRQLGEGGPEGWTCSAADDSRLIWECIDPTSLDPATCVISVCPYLSSTAM